MHFPTFKNTNIAAYYFLTVFLNGWFVLPNWVFYFSQFISIPQIGVIDGISKLVGIFLEVPSGAISDLLGKKRTLIAGNLAISICCILLINADNYVGLLVGNIFMFIGFAFLSGSKEAFLYDSLKDIHQEQQYDEVLGKVNSLATVTTVVSIGLGGFLYRLHPQLTFVAWLIFNVCSMITLAYMREPKTDEEHISYAAYFQKLRDGVRSIFTKSVQRFILPVLFFSTLLRSYEGVIRQNTGAYFGFSGETFGYILALVLIPTMVASYNYKKLSTYFARKIELVFIALYMLAFLLIFITNNLFIGVFSFLSMYVAQEISKPYVLSLVNKHTHSKHRATALSTVSLLSEFPYMFAVLFLGSLLEVSVINYYYGVLLLALVAYLLAQLYFRLSGRQK